MSCPKPCTFADRRVAVHHTLTMPVLHSCDVCSAADCSQLDDCLYVASPGGQAGNVFWVDCDMCVAPSVVQRRTLHMQSCVAPPPSLDAAWTGVGTDAEQFPMILDCCSVASSVRPNVSNLWIVIVGSLNPLSLTFDIAHL